MRDYIDYKERRDAIEVLVRQHFTKLGMPNLELIALLEHFLYEVNVDERRSGGNADFLNFLANHFVTTWNPEDGRLVEVVRERLGGVGPAGSGLVRRLERRVSRGAGGGAGAGAGTGGAAGPAGSQPAQPPR
jgi:hypothetical protein